MTDSKKTLASRDETVSTSDQVERAAVELRRLWTDGKRVGVEDLSESDVLQSKPELLLDAIYHEVLIREQFGEQPDVEKFAARFPEHDEQLRRLFLVHESMKDDGDKEAEDNADGDLMFGEPKAPTQLNLPLGSSPDFRLSGSHIPLASAPPGYELLEELGRGGMAIVYRARHTKLNRIVALKMLLGGSHATAEVLARLEQEARAVAKLQHSAIVQIHEIGEHEGLPFLTLEFVEGGTLRDWLAGRPLPACDAATIAEQLATTVVYAHEQGIVHRDLKPANILLVDRPPDIDSPATVLMESADTSNSGRGLQVQTKISDFGLARMTETGSDLTATGQIIGTPSYMAPEQASAVEVAKPAQDIYSLGAILYELLTGRPPFQGPTVMDTLHQVRNSEPVAPRRLQSRIPRDIETICLKCLDKSANRRYASAEELAADLRRFLDDRPIRATPISAFGAAWRWVKRYPAVAALTTAIVFLTLGSMIAIVREANRANESESDLIIQRDEAQRMEKLAREERDLAEVALNEAEQNLKQAIEAVESLSAVGEQLLSTPHQQKVSQDIFNRTADFYEDFLTRQADDPDRSFRFASALVRAAEVSGTLGDRTKAERQLQQAIKLLHSKSGQRSNRMLPYALWVRGRLFQSTQRYEEALKSFAECTAAIPVLLKEESGGDITSLRILGANATAHSASILRATGKRNQALTAFQDASTQLRNVLKTSPANAQARFDLAQCLTHYGSALRDLNDEGAAAVLDEAVEIGQQLIQESPDDAAKTAWLSFSFYAAALLDKKQGQPEAALEKLEQADALLFQLVDDFPAVFDYRFKFAAVQAQRIALLLEESDTEIAMPLWERFCQHLERSIELFEDDLSFARWSCRWQYAFGDFLFERGRAAEAEHHWRRGLVAGNRLLASNLISDDERREQSTRQSRRLAMAPLAEQQFRQQALELSRQTKEANPNSSRATAAYGLALYENEEFEAAEQALSSARAMSGGIGRIEQWYYAMALWMLERRNEAIAHANGISSDGKIALHETARLNRISRRCREMLPGKVMEDPSN